MSRDFAYQTDIENLANAIEYVTQGMMVINSDHAQHHKGNGYKAYVDITNLASTGTLTYNWHSGENVYCHVKDWNMQVMDSSIKLEIIKGATVTVDTGTTVAFNNTNAITTNTAESTLKASPTYTGGTTWHQLQVLADSTNQVVGVGNFQTSENDELVFKPDTDYIIKITNTGSETISKAFLTIFMYEEEEGIDG